MTDPALIRARRRVRLGAGLIAALGCVPLVALALDDPFLMVTGARVLAFALAAVALDLVLGFGAMVSFGHAAYLGFGAYAVGVLGLWGVSDVLVQMGVAMAVAALFALVTGALSLRTRGVYFIMITLAFSQMAYFFFVSFSALGGDDGMGLAQRSTLLGQSWLESDLAFYLFAWVCLAAGFALAHGIVGSRFGRVLRATRENITRVEALGFEPLRYRLGAFVISGMMTAVAGVLLANQAEFVSPAFMDWHRSGELIVMVVLGGIGTLSGPILGAVVALGLEEALSSLTGSWKLWFGCLLVLVAIVSPRGLSGLIERVRGRGRGP